VEDAAGPGAARAPAAFPRTRATVAADLTRLGLAPGAIVLVHSSLRSVGWVCGGAVAVVEALLDALGPTGTIVVPTQTPEYSDPAGWCSPPVPEAWWPILREQMPAFDPRLTPSQRMGVLAECVRTWPGARRSGHPTVSFAALGADAAELALPHPFDFGLGDDSPLGRLYRRGASVLLIGVGYDVNTAFHLAQARLADRTEVAAGAPVLVDGRRRWVSYREIDLDTAPFERIGAAFEEAGHVRCGTVGAAPARLFALPAAVDFAAAWLASARQLRPPAGSSRQAARRQLG
jgi:aminoglycoside 3-N-acetyltransferase